MSQKQAPSEGSGDDLGKLEKELKHMQKEINATLKANDALARLIEKRVRLTIAFMLC